MWMAVAMAITASLLAADDKGDGKKPEGKTLPAPRFTIQADTNCVVDNLTGLTWARNAGLTGTNQLTWAKAVAFCKELNYGGHTDWRLPSFKEFFSLMDARFKSPAISNTAGTDKMKEGDPFTSVRQYLNGVCYYWVTTTTAGEPGGPWLVSVMNAAQNISSESGAGSGYVWPVRGGP
jgi:hypothetical protein